MHIYDIIQQLPKRQQISVLKMIHDNPSFYFDFKDRLERKIQALTDKDSPAIDQIIQEEKDSIQDLIKLHMKYNV